MASAGRFGRDGGEGKKVFIEGDPKGIGAVAPGPEDVEVLVDRRRVKEGGRTGKALGEPCGEKKGAYRVSC